jgi:hypothetical protein
MGDAGKPPIGRSASCSSLPGSSPLAPTPATAALTAGAATDRTPSKKKPQPAPPPTPDSHRARLRLARAGNDTKRVNAALRAEVKEHAKYNEMSLWAQHKAVKKCVTDALAKHEPRLGDPARLFSLTS